MDLHSNLGDRLLDFHFDMLEDLHCMDEGECAYRLSGNVGGRKPMRNIGSLGMNPQKHKTLPMVLKKENRF